MTGERNLQKLLLDLKPQLDPGEYVFCALEPGIEVPDAEKVGWFREQDGGTTILPRARAAGLQDEYAGRPKRKRVLEDKSPPVEKATGCCAFPCSSHI